MVLSQVDYGFSGLAVLLFILVGVNRVVVQQFPLAVQADQLTAGSETRIDSHHPFGPQWWRQQQLAQISGEHLDCLLFGTLLAGESNLRFHGM